MSAVKFIREKITVFAPATVANVGCGFDVLGFALQEPGDTLTLSRRDQPGLTLSIDGDEGKLPVVAGKNTAGVALLSMLGELKIADGFDLHLHKGLPIGSGLGSSAASAVAAVFALNEMLDEKLAQADVLRHALQGEKLASANQLHADNVGPCLYGGLILARSANPPDIIELPIPPGLHAVIVMPDVQIKTAQARQQLGKTVELAKAVGQWGNIGALVAACYRNDPELLSRAIEDKIAEPIRSQWIPRYAKVKAVGISAGALGVNISGSGPSIFALCADEAAAIRVRKAMCSVFDEQEIAHLSLVSKMPAPGARVV